MASPYQQYPASAPAIQTYGPPQSPYPVTPQQYGPSGVTYAYNQQITQAHSAPSTPQYGNPNFGMPGPHMTYSQTNVPQQQFPGPIYQNPPPPEYSPGPVASQPSPAGPYYPNQTSVWVGQQQPALQQVPQWNNRPRASSSASSYQQQNNPGHRVYSQTPSVQSQIPQTPSSDQITMSQPTPKTSTSTLNQIPVLMTSGHVGRWSSTIKKANPAETTTEAIVLVKTESSNDPQSANTPGSPVHSLADMNAPSRPFTPYKDYEGIMDPLFEDFLTEGFSPATPGDSELGEDERHLAWNLDFKTIFNELPIREQVAIAQPLSSADFEFVPPPIPASQISSDYSVSRNARKDNLKEFIKPIRSHPSWSYMQEDPLFSEACLDGPLIPLDELSEWTKANHAGICDILAEQTSNVSTMRMIAEYDRVSMKVNAAMLTELPWERVPSRKRSRSRMDEDDDHHNFDVQLSVERIEPKSTHTPKRQKSHKIGDNDNMILQQTHETASGGPGTPTLARIGTPFEDEDDVWAPQPGEGAATLQQETDPTEALLKSLGVEGGPKPLSGESSSSLDISSPEVGLDAHPFGNVPKTTSPEFSQAATLQGQNQQSHHNSPTNVRLPISQYAKGRHMQNVYSNSMPHDGLSSNGMNNISQNGMPQDSFALNTPKNGQFAQGNHHHHNHQGQQQNSGHPWVPYSQMRSRQNSYSAGIQPQGNTVHPSQQYNSAAQNSYANGVAPQSQQVQQYANQSYGVAQQTHPVYSNGAPQNGYPVQNQYTNGLPPQNNPSQYTTSQGQAQYGVPQVQAGIPPQGQDQYVTPSQAQTAYNNGQYGPQGNAQYNGQQGTMQYGSQTNPQFNGQQGNPQQVPQGNMNGQQGNIQYASQGNAFNGQQGNGQQLSQNLSFNGHQGTSQQAYQANSYNGQQSNMQPGSQPSPFPLQPARQINAFNGQHGSMQQGQQVQQGTEGSTQHGNKAIYYKGQGSKLSNGPQLGYNGNSGASQPNANNQQSMPQQGAQQALTNQPQGNQSRQDSGYGSVGGSNSNQNGVAGNQYNGQRPNGSSALAGTIDTKMQDAQPAADDDSEPLTPISMELLGKFGPHVSSSKKPEPMRQIDDGGTGVRKPKRPQPVVAAAYRWAFSLIHSVCSY